MQALHNHSVNVSIHPCHIVSRVDGADSDNAPAKTITVPLDSEINCYEILEQRSIVGAVAHYGQPLPEYISKRLTNELEVIKSLKVSSRFLLIQDIINNAKTSNDSIVGPGRGALAGSLVAYFLGITQINPIVHNLLFERFLSNATIFPQIYIDMNNSGVDAVAFHLTNRCRKENGLDILTGSSINEMTEDIVIEPMSALTMMGQVIHKIKENKGVDIKFEKIALDDELTLDLFREGETDSVFGFEEPEMRHWLQELQPTCFTDLAALYALDYFGYGADQIREFISAKHHIKSIEIPAISQVLSETYGMLIYQEQMMKLAQLISGFTPSESNTLRIAMGKKDSLLVEILYTKFLRQGSVNGYNELFLKEIWETWDRNAPLLFNKSHAYCYTLIGYRLAYLKAHYPEIFKIIQKNS